MGVSISWQPATSILMVQDMRVKIVAAASSKMYVTENLRNNNPQKS